MKVTACLVTRGDVDMQPVIDSLPRDWEVVIWDNGNRMVSRSDGWAEVCSDLSVYGRYAAIKHASNDLIFVVDDDVIVSDPQAITTAWVLQSARLKEIGKYQGVVANMPPEFRHSGYTDSFLVGFGACFQRDVPARAFARLGFNGYVSPFMEDDWEDYTFKGAASGSVEVNIPDAAMLRRTCDVVFTTLTPRILVDIPKQDREFASDPNRMWRQQGHVEERTRMLDLARKVRDA